jgi:hypothetical protein
MESVCGLNILLSAQLWQPSRILALRQLRMVLFASLHLGKSDRWDGRPVLVPFSLGVSTSEVKRVLEGFFHLVMLDALFHNTFVVGTLTLWCAYAVIQLFGETRKVRVPHFQFPRR